MTPTSRSLARMQLRRSTQILVFIVSLAASGCAGADDNAGGRPISDVERLVMTRADLPAGYALTEREHSSSPRSCNVHFSTICLQRNLLREVKALGLEDWAATSFRKDVRTSKDETDFNQPISEAIAMPDAKAASQALGIVQKFVLTLHVRRALADDGHSIPAPALGDEAPRGSTLTFAGAAHDGGTLAVFIYAWRRGNVVAWLESTDKFDDLDQRRTLELAQAIDARGTP